MIIDLDDWKEWHGMDTTKQFLGELEQKRSDLLNSIYKCVLNHENEQATSFAGGLAEIESVIDLIHSKKESANGSITDGRDSNG